MEDASTLEKAVKKLTGMFWFRSFMGLSAAVTPFLVSYLILWMQTNFVTAATNREAWEKNVAFMEQVVDRLNEQQIKIAVLEAKNTAQDRELDQLRLTTSELRTILNMPPRTP